MSDNQKEIELLDKTVEGLESSLEKGTMTGASTSVTSWINRLKDEKGFKTISDDLEKLKEAISNKDGKEICVLLDKLGEATVKAAEKVEGKESTAVKKLGNSLISGSKKLKQLVG